MDEYIQCDGPNCPARSYVHARFSGGRELHFCGHHGREYAVALADAAEAVSDDRKQLALIGTVEPAQTSGAFV